jgi:hypothetical protein
VITSLNSIKTQLGVGDGEKSVLSVRRRLNLKYFADLQASDISSK